MSQPSTLLAALQHIAETLTERQQPFALVGGLAVSVRVDPRFTRDIDLAVAVTQIELRGSNRGKSLVQELEQWLARTGH